METNQTASAHLSVVHAQGLRVSWKIEATWKERERERERERSFVVFHSE